VDQDRRCAAIVVSFNSAAELPACLDALAAQRGATVAIHVVDNASSDGSATLVADRYPSVRLVASPVNTGFAGGNNQVLLSVAAPYYALVNPDSVLHPDAIARCLDYLEAHADAAVVGTRLVYPDGRLQPSCHSFLGLRNMFGEAFLLDRLFPGFRPLSSFHMRDFAHDREAAVDWIQGAFLVVRGTAAAQVGGLDSDFFMYGEEMDWCRRFRQAGWQVVYLPDPPVVHVGGASSRPIAGPMFVENLKGRIRFLRKHRGPAIAAAGRALVAVSVTLRWLARELQVGLARGTGRGAGEELRLRRIMFRSAVVWVWSGMRLSPPALPPAGDRRGPGRRRRLPNSGNRARRDARRSS
jgi:GT2 family glycosyltransferase